MIFVDTNYFLRLILRDSNTQHDQAKKLFQEGAEGTKELFTSLLVMFEIYWVLASFYQKNKNEIIKVLQNILQMDFIQFKQKDCLNRALRIYKNENLDLEDCYNLIFAKNNKAKNFKTFDKKLAKRFKNK